MPNKSVNLTEKQTHACAFKIGKVYKHGIKY